MGTGGGSAVGYTSGAASPPSVGDRRGETVRKLLHITPGFLPYLLVLTPHPDPLETDDLLIVGGLTVLFTVVYLSLKRVVGRPGESDFAVTAVSYAAAVLGTLLLFPGAPELAGVVVTIIAFGDGAAYLGGRCFGRRRLPWNPHKTWAGTASFVACAVPAASLAYWLEATPAVSWGHALICAAVPAVAAAVAESIETRVSDNLRVGAAAVVFAVATHFAVLGLGW